MRNATCTSYACGASGAWGHRRAHEAKLLRHSTNHLVDIGFEPSRGDHNLHRRFNANNEIQLYASYIDDGTALFPNDAEYQTFLKELQTKQKNGQTFELGLAQVQTETLGCQVIQASYNAPVGKPDEPGHVSSYEVDVEEGEKTTRYYSNLV